ncbi:SOUL family heme-binding protein [Methanobacterium sp.]|uniref:SOUL family heme-binding protein n=1 Tax=Methanobacterium sp. TaxID=2164 RepID=UPI003C77FA9E
MTETLDYTVEQKEGSFEIRKYNDYILAQVDIGASFDKAIRKGFMILAGYIFGGNLKRSKIAMTAPVVEEKISEKIEMTTPVTAETVGNSEKIAMTTPVTEEKVEDNFQRISFAMPSKYTMDTLPKPNDKRIHFKEFKGQKTAVLRFKGRVKEKIATEKIEELKKWLSKNQIKPRSRFMVAQYNHPAVPGFLRRNEIIVEI